jgi:FixJ family two-component response regulator|tara:strand:- start:70 stop:366 length:297 start_codon:yes stop_codon:yes gene_type:complete
MLNVFQLYSGLATAKVAGTTTSQSVALSAKDYQVRVFNSAASIAFIRFTAGASTAVTTDMPIPPGAVEVFSLNESQTHVSVILASGTGDVYFTSGVGI